MMILDRPVDCDSCGKAFIVEDSLLGSIKEGDFEVQYISCPACGAKHQFLTTDSKMRTLVEQRKALAMKFKAARAKQFKKRTFQKYMKELHKIKQEQEKMLPVLRAQGEKILRETKKGG